MLLSRKDAIDPVKWIHSAPALILPNPARNLQLSQHGSRLAVASREGVKKLCSPQNGFLADQRGWR